MTPPGPMGRSFLDRRAFLQGGFAGAGMLGLAACASRAPGAAPIARTGGGRIAGISAGSVKIFKGIPYGAPTGGANRFRPPQPAAAWSGVREAVAFGPRCPQVDGNAPLENFGGDQTPMDEDCLRLNVWTAGLRDGRRRPVMVWFHGGGFASGSGGSLRCDGTNLAGRHDVVVVTVNHRLNVFGFLPIKADGFAGSGNVGMLDCVAALRWVQDNIENFGGDPGNVTIFGQSGGAGKVTTLMGMPAAAGLFHRAIAQSGLDIRRGGLADAEQAAGLVLRELGLAPGDFVGLQQVPAERLLAASRALKRPVRPVVDGTALLEAPFDGRAPAPSAKVPLLIGSLLTETTYQRDTPLDPFEEPALRQKVAQLIGRGEVAAAALIATYRANRPGADTAFLYQLISTDWNYTATVAEKAALKAAQGAAPAFVYHFEKPTPIQGGRLRVPHTLDLAYMFDNLDLSAAIAGPPADGQPLADKMSAAWVQFARTGNPAVASLPAWPPYDPASRQVMVLADECRVAADPNRAERVAMQALRA